MFLFPLIIYQVSSLHTKSKAPLSQIQLSTSSDSSNIPSSMSDSGSDTPAGETYYILLTTFLKDETGTGKLYVMPGDPDLRDYTYELITGLDEPVSSCFDKNHNFLYIVDSGFDETGYIYRYSIDWNKNKFVLADDEYVVVYEGLNPKDCKIDEYGNMYFIEADYDSINMISYLDLYTGLLNMNYTIYESDPYVSNPSALDVVSSEYIYFANKDNGDEVGSVNKAEAYNEYVNGGTVKILVKNTYNTLGVAHSKKGLVYFTLETGDVWVVDDSDPELLYPKAQGNFTDPQRVAYGSGLIYVTDYEEGQLWTFNDNNDEELPSLIIELQGCYSVFCVNKESFCVLLSVAFTYLVI